MGTGENFWLAPVEFKFSTTTTATYHARLTEIKLPGEGDCLKGFSSAHLFGAPFAVDTKRFRGDQGHSARAVLRDRFVVGL